MKPTVVILAAGRGERFLRDGVTVPKPMIEFQGKALLLHTIEAVLGSCNGLTIKPLLVCPWSISQHLRFQQISVSHVQPGPVASAVLALGHADPSEPIVFFDCDNVFNPPPDLRNILGRDFVVTTELEAPDLNFSCVSGSEQGALTITEKTGLSPEVCVGVYGFAKASDFQRRAWKILSNAPDAPMSAVANTGSLCSLRIPKTSWTPIGTPEQLSRALSQGLE